MFGFVRPNVKKNLQDTDFTIITKKGCKFTHLTSWNQQVFDICVRKLISNYFDNQLIVIFFVNQAITELTFQIISVRHV